ncbi:hypothetical protein [Congregibacter variabilis]|uniref:hypothetical protein n=1 Tax=Congregibacter variabilis TaxID=3081200 RepID=UPI00388EC577
MRRFTQHVTDQNWFAVVLDFVIVVIGVFMGLQVQEWASNRQLEQQKTEYLSELREEITLNVSLFRGRLETMTHVLESGERAIAFLEADEQCDAECWPIFVDFFNASQVLFSPVTKTVYEEMQRLGLMRSKSVKGVVEPFYVLSETLLSGLDSSPAYRQRFRKMISARAHKSFWQTCHRMDGVIEYLVADCPLGISEQEVVILVEKIREDSAIEDELNYWVGMHFFYMPIFEDLITYGKSAIDAIDLALADR